MPEFLRRDKGEIADAEELDAEKAKALTDETRRKIIHILAEKPSYPARIASELGIGKQQAYYHFQKLEDAGLIVKDREEKKSGGMATYYRPSSDGYLLDLGSGGRKEMLPGDNGDVRAFLDPLVCEGEIHGTIIVGSPDQHGEHQVRARDGHLAGEIGAKLGNFGDSSGLEIRLDTEVVRDNDFDDNFVLLGGLLTNTVTRKFNEYLPAKFSEESFPYHEIHSPEATYSDGSIGVVQKIQNPENPEKAVYLVAGIRNRGTEGAVRAFKNLEDIIEGYEEGEFYIIVKGLDMDGDGEIDDYEVVE